MLSKLTPLNYCVDNNYTKPLPRDGDLNARDTDPNNLRPVAQ